MFGELQKRMEMDGKLARWIRAYIFASFCASERKAKGPSYWCCNIKEEVAPKGQGEKCIPFSLAQRQLNETQASFILEFNNQLRAAGP